MRQDERLDREAREQFEAGNWPPCPMCSNQVNIGYMGVLAHTTTFICGKCKCIFAMNLADEDS